MKFLNCFGLLDFNIFLQGRLAELQGRLCLESLMRRAVETMPSECVSEAPEDDAFVILKSFLSK